jgi:hypothetical protein
MQLFSKELSHKDALTILKEMFDGSSDKVDKKPCKAPSDSAAIYACNLKGKDIDWEKNSKALVPASMHKKTFAKPVGRGSSS